MDPHLRAHFRAVGHSTPRPLHVPSRLALWKVDAVDEVGRELNANPAMFESKEQLLASQPSTAFGRAVALLRSHVQRIHKDSLEKAWHTWRMRAIVVRSSNLTQQLQRAQRHSGVMLLHRFVVPLWRRRRDAFVRWRALTANYRVSHPEGAVMG